MPKYTFKCCNCNNTEQTHVRRSVTELTCNSCNSIMSRQMPTLSGSADVHETIDNYTGTAHREDQRQVVEHRRDEYYWTVEVPRFVDSGTYTVETMLEMGWIFIDDKGGIQVNNKPPHRR